MKNFVKLLLIFSLFISVYSCSGKKETDDIKNNTVSAENLYKLAMLELDNKNYNLAIEKFEEIEFIYPLSNEAVQSKLMIAFIEYVNMNYEESIFKFNRVINNYPSHKNIDYAYYMKAMCYFEQIENEYLDGNNNIMALESFEQIINRFPESEYARDSEQKIILIKQNIAAKHMDIAHFYLKQKKYLAALKRYQKVIDNHSESKFTPEALHRMVEIYYSLGMKGDAEKTAALLGYNYPQSDWYKFSYELVGEKEISNEKKSFIKRLFLKEDEKK